MKIRELFKQIEQANEIAKNFGECYGIKVSDIYWDEIFTTYAEFKKWVKTEINRPWADILLDNRVIFQTSDNTYSLNSIVETYRGTEMYKTLFEIVNNVTSWSVR